MQLFSLAILSMAMAGDSAKYSVQLVSDVFNTNRYVVPRSVDLDGSVYFYEGTKHQNYLWAKGSFKPFSVDDSPLKNGEIMSVRNGIIGITSNDIAVRKMRSFLKVKGKWIELPYSTEADPTESTPNVFIMDVNKRGDAVGRWGTGRYFFKYDSKAKTSTYLPKYFPMTINDDGSFTGMWRVEENDWKSARATVGFDTSAPVLQNPDNDPIMDSYTNAKGLTVATGQRNLYLYKKGSTEAERVLKTSPVSGFEFNGDYFLDPKGRILSTIQKTSQYQPVIYDKDHWSAMMPMLPSDLKYENLAVWLVNKEGIIICRANPIGDLKHYVFLKLTAK